VLRHLLDAGLFVVEIDAEHVRYHTLFREFLYARLPEARRSALHLRAAQYFHARGDKEDAVHHFLRAPAYEEAADLILETGRMMINGGRLESLSGWMALLPPQTLETRPGLLTFLGDIDRLHSRFAEAMRWYRQGEERCRLRADLPGIAQALRGQARIYLDTVNPAMAEAPLREALRLSDGQEDRESRATLLEMLAENQLNLGHSEEARTLQMQARRLREEGRQAEWTCGSCCAPGGWTRRSHG
jgi:ATP/maltotriose-dependent transcriptional regulator MalT